MHGIVYALDACQQRQFGCRHLSSAYLVERPGHIHLGMLVPHECQLPYIVTGMVVHKLQCRFVHSLGHVVSVGVMGYGCPSLFLTSRLKFLMRWKVSMLASWPLWASSPSGPSYAVRDT